MSYGPINGVDPDKVLPARYDISVLKPIAKRAVPDDLRKRLDPLTRVLMGRDATDMSWIATQAFDGQIEVSFAYSHRRPSNWEVMRFMRLVGMTYIQEESRKVGKVRHFVVQAGVQQ